MKNTGVHGATSYNIYIYITESYITNHRVYTGLNINPHIVVHVHVNADTVGKAIL